MEKAYIAALREEIARKFEQALAVAKPIDKPLDPQEVFKLKADRLIQAALKARPGRAS